MEQKDQIVRLIENRYAITGLRRDGIVHVYYKTGVEINLELQLEMKAVFLDVTGGRKHPFIFQSGSDVTVTKEARDHAIEMELSTPINRTVVFVQNLAHKIIAEFYYKFNKPVNPYKVVSDFQEGIDWLLEVEQEI